MANSSRGSFSGRLGVILASAGSAVGLGNVWRFPTEAGRNGGAAFILLYLGMVLLVAMPVMVGEFVVGRASKANALQSFSRLGGGRAWQSIGVLSVLGGFMILSFYCVVAGWTLASLMDSAGGDFAGGDYAAEFNSFVSDPGSPVFFLALFMLMTHFVVARGVQRGIERFSKMMMPLLLIIVLLLMIFSLNMPGAMEGVRFLFRPDFSKLTVDVVLSAMGQAFFTLSVGICCLATYASYFKAETPLITSAVNVCVIDTLVAVMSGLILFPAIFSVPGVEVDAGPTLVFITLPHVLDYTFSGSPVLRYVFYVLFYALLFLAALTSSISLHEINTAVISERRQISRQWAACIVTVVCTLFGIVCSLSFGPWRAFTLFGMSVFDCFDFVSAKYIMPLGGLLITLFVGWRMERSRVMDELTNGGKLSFWAARVMYILIRWVSPVGVAVVFINELL
ncbi:MAG: sodium-dependent transporter [Bacteroidaceae bacterium]|nr:sodium-dependent transporter [Bacteroidaceae bacterium]